MADLELIEAAFCDLEKMATGIQKLAVPALRELVNNTIVELRSDVRAFRGCIEQYEERTLAANGQAEALNQSLVNERVENRRLHRELAAERHGLVTIKARREEVDRKKILAIKHVRDWQGCGLAEAKTLVESLIDDPELTLTVPRIMNTGDEDLQKLWIFAPHPYSGKSRRDLECALLEAEAQTA